MSCETIIRSDKVFELIESKNQTIIVEKQVETETFLDIQTQTIEAKKQNQAVTEFITGIPEHSHGSPLEVIETTIATIEKGVPHTLPQGFTYIPDPTGQVRNLWVWVDGQRLAPSVTGIPRDYEEINSQQVIFNRTIAPDSNIIYAKFH